MIEYTIEVNPSNPNAPIIAKWLREVYPDKLTIKEALEKAKDIVLGKVLQVPYLMSKADCDCCTVKEVYVENEYERTYRLISEEHAYYTKLLNDGANGNEAAAIEYCKAVVDGKIARLSMPYAG